MLSWTYVFTYIEPFDEDYLSPAALDRALEFAEAAVGLDADLPQARAQLGYVLLLRGQHDDPSPNSSEPSPSTPITSTPTIRPSLDLGRRARTSDRGAGIEHPPRSLSAAAPCV